MKTFKLSCRKAKMSSTTRGGNFQFSARCERCVYLRNSHHRVNFTLPTCSTPLMKIYIQMGKELCTFKACESCGGLINLRVIKKIKLKFKLKNV